MRERVMNYRHCCMAVLAVLVAACARRDMPSPSVCAHPPRGVIVDFDTIAYFPTRAPLSQLDRICPVGEETLYDDAVGWQGVARAFPFAGAQIRAVQSEYGFGQPLRLNEPADLWTARGDSVR